MNKRIIVVMLMILLPFVSQTLFSKTNDIKQVVIFGDSYSDNGNTYKRSSNTYPGRAYFLGHFTNGPNWADYLAIKLGFNIRNTKVYRNYAYGQGQILVGGEILQLIIIQNLGLFRFLIFQKKLMSIFMMGLSNQLNLYILYLSVRMTF